MSSCTDCGDVLVSKNKVDQKATVASNCIKIPKLPLDDLEDGLQNNTEGHTKDTTLKAYREEQF